MSARMEIRRAGDPVLKEIARPVARITKSTRTLLDNMILTMRDADGVGLAAPQVGVSVRVIIVDVGEGLIELINPIVIETEGCETATEGCLSVPGMYGDVERAARITVEGWNRKGETIRIIGSGLLARAVQHEIDHLDGVLFIERAQTLFKEQKGE